MEANSIKLVDIQIPLRNSLRNTQEKYNCEIHNDLIKFQHLYENDHGCSVLKLYSQKHYITSKYTDITYWESLQFKSKEDITMFILRWS
jgi:hypothetical protein